MLYINVKFQEEYKRLDALCKDLLGGEVGITEYINQMDLTPPSEQALVSSWHSDYKTLKHLRWVRNKLAHEVGSLDEELCTEDDIKWLIEFYNRIKNGSDPFSIIRLSKSGKKKSRVEKNGEAKPKKKSTKSSTKKTEAKGKKPKASQKKQEAEQSSLWTRFINGIKDLLKL